ncbi:hypothetical protein Lalb_Chr11g0075731 [Lupinus albus]|uniref:Uncharacterized protein n=1 Tax=Lupinus albus TaxID=3870 RepID=A0A6A4PT42_LUPAL|nr:hypothetical protein Lalb_Chr11g0075731 [Lupinus albus]
MAYFGILAICEGRYNFSSLRSNLQKASKTNYCRSRTSFMEFESDWIKHTNSSAYTAQVKHSATSIMPWSCRVPIGEGYHEFI